MNLHDLQLIVEYANQTLEMDDGHADNASENAPMRV